MHKPHRLLRSCVKRASAISLTVLVGASLCSPQTTPSIQIASVPTFGAIPGVLAGRVLGVSPNDYRVTALVFVSGLGFFTKPFCTSTTTPLSAADGSFSVLLTTGGIDQVATYIAVLVVPASATVPCYAAEPGVPAALEQQAVAELLIHRPDPNQRQIQFSGRTWLVKSSPAPVGPGPNFFSDATDNVFVDGLGRLHLKIVNVGGQWRCAEILSKQPIGYGRYTVQVDSLPQFDKNVVFGAFTWADAERSSREIDLLELGVFGNASDTNNAQNVVQPFTLPGNQMRFVLPLIAPTVHTMTWQQGAVSFSSFDRFGALLHNFVYSGQPPATDSPRLNFRLNFWLVAPPSDGNAAEIVVNHVSLMPVSKPGVVDNGLWYLADDSGGVGGLFGFGLAGSTPVTGDWNGSGDNKIGAFANGVWYLGGELGSLQSVIGFGSPSAKPVVGDWDGTGTTKIGVFDKGLWYLADSAGGIYKVIGFGSPAAKPVVGDWDGTGTSKIGVFDNGLWFLANSAGGIYKVIGFGQPTATPVVGDWDGTGTTKVGVFDHGLWFLANTTGGIAKVIGFGQPSAKPVIGDWDGNGTTNIGVFDNGLWYLGNDAGGIYKVIGFGSPTATPVVGRW
jgi:hypothetical protein